MTQKVHQKFQTKISQQKSAPKVPKFLGWRGGGVRPGLENTQIKAEFFMEHPLLVHLKKASTELARGGVDMWTYGHARRVGRGPIKTI